MTERLTAADSVNRPAEFGDGLALAEQPRALGQREGLVGDVRGELVALLALADGLQHPLSGTLVLDPDHEPPGRRELGLAARRQAELIAALAQKVNSR